MARKPGKPRPKTTPAPKRRATPRPRSRTPSRRKLRGPDWRLLAASVGLFALIFVGGLLWPLADLPMPAKVPGRGAPEVTSVEVARVIDGDTLVLVGGEKVRILNIDTAEMPPRAQCVRERDLALAAKARLTQVVNEGHVITLARKGRDLDGYGRQLRLVQVDGRDVGELLVREGLAEPWRGHKASWC